MVITSSLPERPLHTWKSKQGKYERLFVCQRCGCWFPIFSVQRVPTKCPGNWRGIYVL